MSELKTDKLAGRNEGITLGDSGDTFTVPSGATFTSTSATVSLPSTVTVTTELLTNKISPASGTGITLGDSGDTFTIPSGATIVNSGTSTGFGDGLKLIQSQSASDSATIDFTSGIDSTYDEYIFYFCNMRPATDAQNFMFQGNAVGQSGFNETITSTSFYALHGEDGSSGSIGYDTGRDQAEGTSYQVLFGGVGNDSDESGVGEVHLFSPSSTTYVKNFYCTSAHIHGSGYAYSYRTGGYFNTTAAIDEISFKFESGNIAYGTIKLYGVI